MGNYLVDYDLSSTISTLAHSLLFSCFEEMRRSFFGCESSPISRNVHSLVSQSFSACINKCKIMLNKAN